MDPSEIVKHLPEAVSVAKVAAASIPFTSIVKRMLGPAADEVAEMWRDQVRVYRYERQVTLLGKVERIAADRKLTLGLIPPKILFPLLEGASFEDDENLHDMWAALMVNAALPETAKSVRPGYIALLHQLARDEAILLNWMFTEFTDPRHPEPSLLNPKSIFGEWRLQDVGMAMIRAYGSDTPPDLAITLANLQAFGVVFMQYRELGEAFCSFTGRGLDFMRACQPPKPKS